MYRGKTESEIHDWFVGPREDGVEEDDQTACVNRAEE